MAYESDLTLICYLSIWSTLRAIVLFTLFLSFRLLSVFWDWLFGMAIVWLDFGLITGRWKIKNKLSSSLIWMFSADLLKRLIILVVFKRKVFLCNSSTNQRLDFWGIDRFIAWFTIACMLNKSSVSNKDHMRVRSSDSLGILVKFIYFWEMGSLIGFLFECTLLSRIKRKNVENVWLV